MRKNIRFDIRAAISVIAIGALVVRAAFPDLQIDSVSLGLIALASVPWMSGLFETLEFPGGWKFSFRDLREAQKIFQSGDTTVATSTPTYELIKDLDPELALVALRIEIEKGLRILASDIQSGSDRLRPTGASGLLRFLVEQGAVPREIAGGLKAVIDAGNHASHGVELPDELKSFAIDTGPAILDWLERAKGLAEGQMDDPKAATK